MEKLYSRSNELHELMERLLKYPPYEVSICGDISRVLFKDSRKFKISHTLTPDVNKFEKGSGWYWLFSQISQKRVDFVFTEDKLNLICAIELNYSSLEQDDRKKVISLLLMPSKVQTFL